MSTRAKFKVRTVVETEGNGHAITLDAVYDPDPDSENGRFFRWTPSGTITMAVVNAEAAKSFVEGGEVYVDFTPATEG